MPNQSLSNFGKIDPPFQSHLQTLTSPLHSLGGGVRNREGLYALQEPELWCFINTDEVTDLKHTHRLLRWKLTPFQPYPVHWVRKGEFGFLSGSCLLSSSGAGSRIKRLHNASQKGCRKPPLAAVLDKKPVWAVPAVMWFGGSHPC